MVDKIYWNLPAWQNQLSLAHICLIFQQKWIYCYQKQACVEVEDIEQFKYEMNKLIVDPAYRTSLGQQAKCLTDAEAKIAEKISG